MIEGLIAIGGPCGVEMWKETKVMRISKQASPIHIMIEQRQPEDVDCFS